MIELDQIKCEILEKSPPGMTMVNEREIEREKEWVLDLLGKRY